VFVILVLYNTLEDYIIARNPTAWERLTARLRAAKLDRDLAAGASPDGTAPLALRAQKLMRLSARIDLARSLQRVLDDASQPAPIYTARAGGPQYRARVSGAASELHALIERLLTPGLLPIRGLAEAYLLLTEGSGPLYSPNGDLRAAAHNALQALDPLNNL
jgi:hypothetical protein